MRNEALTERLLSNMLLRVHKERGRYPAAVYISGGFHLPYWRMPEPFKPFGRPFDPAQSAEMASRKFVVHDIAIRSLWGLPEGHDAWAYTMDIDDGLDKAIWVAP